MMIEGWEQGLYTCTRLVKVLARAERRSGFLIVKSFGIQTLGFPLINLESQSYQSWVT